MLNRASRNQSWLLPDPPGGVSVDDAFEHGLWRNLMRRDDAAARRPWLVWMLIALPVAALAAFLFWPGQSVSRDAGRTAVGSDAVWSGVIRQVPHARPKQDALTHVATPLKSNLMPAATLDSHVMASALPARALSHAAAMWTEDEPAGPVPDMVEQIQQLLTERGYAPGPVDGVIGKRTRIAIMAWQLDQGLPVKGDPDEQVLNRLSSRQSQPVAARRVSWRALSNHERTIIRDWCDADRADDEPDAYYQCVGEQMAQLTAGARMPAAREGSIPTRQVATAHAACVDRLGLGPQTYFRCVGEQMDTRSVVAQVSLRD